MQQFHQIACALLDGVALVSKEWAEEIGADGFAENVIEAVKMANMLIGGDK